MISMNAVPPTNRAIEEIKSDAHRLVTVRILGAVEAREWASVHKLAEQLQEIAQCGLYHESLIRAKEIGSMALGSHQEREAR
jgi:hypothetical protein